MSGYGVQKRIDRVQIKYSRVVKRIDGVQIKYSRVVKRIGGVQIKYSGVVKRIDGEVPKMNLKPETLNCWGVFTELCLTFFFEEKNYTCLLRYLPTVGQGWQGT